MIVQGISAAVLVFVIGVLLLNYLARSAGDDIYLIDADGNRVQDEEVFGHE